MNLFTLAASRAISGGGSSVAMIVNLVNQGSYMSADRTFGEIYQAVRNGTPLIFVDNNGTRWYPESAQKNESNPYPYGIVITTVGKSVNVVEARASAETADSSQSPAFSYS